MDTWWLVSSWAWCTATLTARALRSVQYIHRAEYIREEYCTSVKCTEQVICYFYLGRLGEIKPPRGSDTPSEYSGGRSLKKAVKGIPDNKSCISIVVARFKRKISLNIQIK